MHEATQRMHQHMIISSVVQHIDDLTRFLAHIWSGTPAPTQITWQQLSSRANAATAQENPEAAVHPGAHAAPRADHWLQS